MAQSKSITDSAPQSPGTVGKGNWGEAVAAQYLLTNGYAIVEQKWRCGHYEVDIIAQKGTRIIFVEVKTRKDSYVDPLSAVNASKQQRIIRSADAYMRRFDIPLEYQFDIITIIGNANGYELEHIPDAFFPRVRR